MSRDKETEKMGDEMKEWRSNAPLERRKTTSPIIHEGFLETRQGPKQW
jgi:hypothetical protein